jgi:hypothetical protein
MGHCQLFSAIRRFSSNFLALSPDKELCMEEEAHAVRLLVPLLCFDEFFFLHFLWFMFLVLLLYAQFLSLGLGNRLSAVRRPWMA